MKKVTEVGRATGFTLVELLLSMSIFAILSSLVVVNLIRPQTKASLDSTVTTLVADLRGQQTKAMVGSTESSASAQAYGLYLEPSRYTLFKGDTYNASDIDNFVVNLDSSTSLTNSFSNSRIIFSKRSGEVSNYSESANTITVSNTTGEQKVITINQYGVPH